MREAEIVIHKSVRSPNDGGDIILSDSISQLLLDHIEVVDVGLVVLAVVDLHYLGRDHLHVGIVGIGWTNNQLIEYNLKHIDIGSTSIITNSSVMIQYHHHQLNHLNDHYHRFQGIVVIWQVRQGVLCS